MALTSASVVTSVNFFIYGSPRDMENHFRGSSMEESLEELM